MKLLQKPSSQAVVLFISVLLALGASAPLIAKAPTIDPADDAKHLGRPDWALQAAFFTALTKAIH